MKENQSLPTYESANTSPPYKTNPLNHILVVEDDDGLRNLNVEALERAGYQVDDAVDGAAAWQTLRSHGYDLMITDQNMPRVSGVELLKKLHAAHMSMPVIMATGTLPTAEFTRCPWLQPTAMLLKPYTLDEMLRTVKQILCEKKRSAAISQLLIDSEMTDNKISPASAPARVQRQGAAKSSNHILVVDENPDLRQMYAEALAGPGYHVDGVEDGYAGWEALQVNDYNLLITEHDLPKLTGVELVRKMRAAHMALPVIMAAGRLPAFEVVRSPSLEIAAILSKPFPVDALLDTVEKILHADGGPREQIAPPN